MTLFSLTLILFLIMDPLGKVTLFMNALEPVAPEKRLWVSFRELFFALLLMLTFNLLGETLLTLLQVSETTVRLSSGVILFIVSIRILYPPTPPSSKEETTEEPFFVPLAIPGIASPALLATIMLFTSIVPGLQLMTLAIVIAWSITALLLINPSLVQRTLGANGLMAFERLIGMILVLLAIQRFMDGVKSFMLTL
jgi:multiple antibiotic resistance protein